MSTSDTIRNYPAPVVCDECYRYAVARWERPGGMWPAACPDHEPRRGGDFVPVNLWLAHDRGEDEPCQRGTVGCAINHEHGDACDVW